MGRQGVIPSSSGRNSHNNTVDNFDSSFHLAHFGPNAFVDPTTGPDAIPSNFAPFGIKNFNGTLFVTYAEQDAAKHDDVAGVGNANGYAEQRGATKYSPSAPVVLVLRAFGQNDGNGLFSAVSAHFFRSR
jgi:hypothetical protein